MEDQKKLSQEEEALLRRYERELEEELRLDELFKVIEEEFNRMKCKEEGKIAKRRVRLLARDHARLRDRDFRRRYRM